MNRNSKEVTCRQDLDTLKSDLARSGHNPSKLDELEPKAAEKIHRSVDPDHLSAGTSQNMNSIVFAVNYFVDLPELKKVISELGDDISALCGLTRTIVATRKGRSVGNRVLRNKGICEVPLSLDIALQPHSQRCGARLCLSCKLMANGGDVLQINGLQLTIPDKYDCSTSSCIYVAQCRICNPTLVGMESTYFGQTVQQLHCRFNGHRSKFNDIDYKKSALSWHAFLEHPDNFTLDIFLVAVVKKVKPCALNREEFRFSELYKTNVTGLNRMKIES